MGKQYSTRSGSAGRSRVMEAGGEEGRDESVVWLEIGRDGRESTGEDGGGETKRGRRNMMVGRVRDFAEKVRTG